MGRQSKAKDIQLWCEFYPQAGMFNQFYIDFKQLCFTGITKAHFHEFLASWERRVQDTRFDNLRDRFMCITRYLSTTYGHNTDLWSIIILPSGREERHTLYANTTNALESLHRQLNRWVRNYERGNINTIASYLVSLYGELDNEIIIMESGQRRLDINSFDKGLARVICRLDCQRKWHGRVDTLDDVLLFCSELRDAERQAQNVSRSVKQFKEFATRHCIRNPDDFYFFESL